MASELGTDRGWDAALARWSPAGVDRIVKRVGGRVASRAASAGTKAWRGQAPRLTGALRRSVKPIRRRRGGRDGWTWEVRWTADPAELRRAGKPGGVVYFGRLVNRGHLDSAYAFAVSRGREVWRKHAAPMLRAMLEGRES